MSKIILDLCGGTGSWSQPYKDNGYDVRLVTLPDMDVRFYVPPANVYGVLCAPPCTVFAASGARWYHTEEEIKDALSVVYACQDIIRVCNPIFWCLENPVGTLYRYIGRPYMYFQPYEYGDTYSKKTCLWGNFNVPQQKIVKNTDGSKMWYLYGGKSEKTKMLRSKTPSGFAQAFYEANK